VCNVISTPDHAEKEAQTPQDKTGNGCANPRAGKQKSFMCKSRQNVDCQIAYRKNVHCQIADRKNVNCQIADCQNVDCQNVDCQNVDCQNVDCQNVDAGRKLLFSEERNFPQNFQRIFFGNST
jgi:hypothetical protein